MATKLYPPPAHKPQPISEGAVVPEEDSKEGEHAADGSPSSANPPPKASGLLWRVTSGAVGGVMGVASTAASGVRWAASKGAEVGGAVVGTVSNRLPNVQLPFRAKKKDKDD